MTLQELLNYWQVIRKRLTVIGLLIGATVGTLLLISFISKPAYSATALFQVTAPLPTEVSVVSDYRQPTSREELNYTRSNFLAVLKSEFVAGEVVETLGLDMDAEQLMKQMTIEPDSNSDFVKLRVTAHSPELAADIANALMEVASRYFGELSAQSFTANKIVIQEQLQARKAELDEARAVLVQFQIENKVGTLLGLLSSQEDLITSSKAFRDKALAEGDLSVAAKYEEIIAMRERELQERVRLNAQYEDLQRTERRLVTTYENLLDKETEVELKENEILSAKFIRVIPARAPARPLSRIDTRILLLAALVSSALGIMLAFGLEYLDRRTATLKETKTTIPLRPPLEHVKEERVEVLADAR